MNARKSLNLAAVLLAMLVMLPLLSVAFIAFSGNGAGGPGAWSHLVESGLARYTFNSLALLALVAVGVIAVGVGAAWLTALCEFPGRAWLEVALMLPLALPGYVIAYAYTDFLQFSGPVQSGLRGLLGVDGSQWMAAGYWFPEVRSLPGAAAMLVLVLYPYVYLPVRAAFAAGGANLTEAARTLGRGAWAAFATVAVPLARPAIVAGVTLALMETLADYGAVAHFGVETLTTGIYKAWFGLGDKAAAARLALLLLFATLVLVSLERATRGRARFAAAGAGSQRPLFRFTGARGVAAALAALLPALLGFFVPVGILLRLASQETEAVAWARFAVFAGNSVQVGLLAALCAVGAALTIAYCVRGTPRMGVVARAASLGYAVPGAVIAVGVLVPLAAFDNALDAMLRENFGIRTGLLLTGSVAALVFACVVRFLAVALNNVDAGLARVTTSMDDAARGMGLGPGATLVRVHAPLIVRSLFIAALLVFVDAIKELPATLAVRPFNFDTLATTAYTLAKDERLGEAAWPCLAIVLASLGPVVLVARSLRTGQRPASVINRTRIASA
ncbi:MAG: iron ABC transporter permease [Burkholderiales bacterium]|nr:iron ABC transporter permease [Burkholderiales bacterium]